MAGHAQLIHDGIARRHKFAGRGPDACARVNNNNELSEDLKMNEKLKSEMRSFKSNENIHKKEGLFYGAKCLLLLLLI